MAKEKIMIRSSSFELMATLYDVDVRTINEHIKKYIYNDNELTEDSTIRNFWIVQIEGNRISRKWCRNDKKL